MHVYAQPPHYRFLILTCLSPHAGLHPPSSSSELSVDKRRVSYIFTASPITGVTYRVAFIPRRAFIRQPQTDTINNASFHTKSGLAPDVKYRLWVVALLNGVKSVGISKNVTTRPDGKTIRTVCYVRKCDP